MSSPSSEAREQVRQVAEKAVKILEPRVGSRMLAYRKVAAVIGVSASWVRKFITVEGTPEPRWSTGIALVEYYQKLCVQADQDVSEQRQDIIKIIG